MQQDLSKCIPFRRSFAAHHIFIFFLAALLKTATSTTLKSEILGTLNCQQLQVFFPAPSTPPPACVGSIFPFFHCHVNIWNISYWKPLIAVFCLSFLLYASNIIFFLLPSPNSLSNVTFHWSTVSDKIAGSATQPEYYFSFAFPVPASNLFLK